MRRIFYILVMLAMVACEDGYIMEPLPSPDHNPGIDDSGGEGDVPGVGDGPTKPIKKRPITPSGKVQRPRYTVYLVDLSFVLCHTSDVGPTQFTLRSEDRGVEHSVVLRSLGDEVRIPLDELGSEVTIITESNDEVEVEYFKLREE